MLIMISLWRSFHIFPPVGQSRFMAWQGPIELYMWFLCSSWSVLIKGAYECFHIIYIFMVWDDLIIWPPPDPKSHLDGPCDRFVTQSSSTESRQGAWWPGAAWTNNMGPASCGLSKRQMGRRGQKQPDALVLRPATGAQKLRCLKEPEWVCEVDVVTTDDSSIRFPEGEHAFTALESSGGVLYTATSDALHWAWWCKAGMKHQFHLKATWSLEVCTESWPLSTSASVFYVAYRLVAELLSFPIAPTLLFASTHSSLWSL